MSEINGEIVWCRDRLMPYLHGSSVLDIGFGGSPIVPWAICLDRPEGHPERAVVPPPVPPTHLVGDATNLYWFKDGVIDAIGSSHCLEDFEDTVGVLREWLRVLRKGGRLALFLPDQAAYVAYCRSVNEPANGAHKHADFSLAYMKRCLADTSLPPTRVLHELWPVHGNPYSFDLVVEKL